MEKKYLFLLLLLLTVGFASVNTYLDLNGKVDMSLLESDLDVVFKEVLLNKEKSDNTIIIENGKSFIYSADDLSKDNATSNIDYVVMNRSHQYDVEVTVSCTTDYETYLNYNGTFDNNKLPLEKGILIEAGEVKSGNIVTELISENTSEESLVLKCTLNYIPVSRETIVEDEEYLVTLDSGYEEKLGDIKVKYYEEYNKLPELTRSNYKFLGWYTEEDIKVDNNSLVKIKGSHTLKAKWQKICEYDPGKEWTFDYTGSEQEFSVPCDGNYKMELWGAQGNNHGKYVGGLGAYTSGVIKMSENKELYLYVGSQPLQRSGGYNGGGEGSAGDIRQNFIINNGGGGGATDIRLVGGSWNDFGSLKSRIMVSSGGSGAVGETKYSYSLNNGNIGGGLMLSDIKYTDSKVVVYGATQISAGYSSSHEAVTGGLNDKGGFGFGGSGFHTCSLEKHCILVASGGGSGYYGGGSGGDYNAAGGGGTSFISGHNGCNAIAESSTSSNIIHTGQPNHYSGYVFIDTVMVDGAGYKWTNVKGEQTGMPTHDGTSTMTGNSGNGYAKITLISID